MLKNNIVDEMLKVELANNVGGNYVWTDSEKKEPYAIELDPGTDKSLAELFENHKKSVEYLKAKF